MPESIPIAATPPARLDAGCRRRHERPIRARAIEIGADADGCWRVAGGPGLAFETWDFRVRGPIR